MIYLKTESGQRAFKERSPLFSARQRSAFILFDGHKTVTQVLAATSGLSLSPADIDHLVAQGFLTPAPGTAMPPGPAPAVSAPQTSDAATQLAGSRTPQQRYGDAKPIATRLVASLGLRGFMLNLSIESAAGYEDLLALLPKIQAAVGSQAASELERALKD